MRLGDFLFKIVKNKSFFILPIDSYNNYNYLYYRIRNIKNKKDMSIKSSKEIMTAQEIKEMPSNKIRTIATKVGRFGTSMKFKVMKEKDFIVVVTREGLLKYLGNAQYAYMSGVKNKDYKIFKSANAAANFINK